MNNLVNKHILVVCQYFYPEQFRINDICLEWIKRGYKVTVLTGIPNYPQGKYYKGYDLFHKRREKWNNIDIIRIPLIPRGHNLIMLALNYLSFVISGFFWKLRTKINADFVFVFGVSPITLALPGIWIAQKRKITCYLYVQDLWPESVEIVTGIHNKMVIESIGRLVNYIYSKCDHIFATSPSFVEEIQKRCVNKTKVTYWPQYAEDFYKPMKKCIFSAIPDDGKLKIAFTGNIGQAQGLQILPEVAKKLKEKKLKKEVEFVIVGDGRYKEKLIDRIYSLNVTDSFILINRQLPDKIPEILSCCDFAFLSLIDTEIFKKTIPAKLQSYMACGKPILASAVGETERVIKEANCGICVKIANVDELYNSIVDIVNMDESYVINMGNNAYSYFCDHFTKTLLMDDIQKYFI